MLVECTVTEQRPIKKEIELPYCSKRGSFLFRINENESILSLIAYDSWVDIALTLKGGIGYDRLLGDVLKAEPCSDEEVCAVAEKINDFMAQHSSSKKELVAV